MSKYLDFYNAKMSGDEDLFVEAYGADVAAQAMGQISSQLSMARTQRQTGLDALSQGIAQLEQVDNQIKEAVKKIKPWLTFAAEKSLRNKTKARIKIEGLVNPEKAKEAKRLVFAFPAVIGTLSLIGGSKFWKLNSAIKDSFDLSFDLLGYIRGARTELLKPTIAALKTSKKALENAPIPNSINNANQLKSVIAKYEKATAVVDQQLKTIQGILNKVKGKYVDNMSSVLQRSNAIFNKVVAPVNFIIKTLEEGATTRDEAREQRQERREERRNRRRNRRQGRRSTRKGSKSVFSARDRQKVLNKVRRSKRKDRAKALSGIMKPLISYKEAALEEGTKVRNELPGQITDAVNQIQKVRDVLKQINQQLKSAQNVLGSANIGSANVGLDQDKMKKNLLWLIGGATAISGAIAYKHNMHKSLF